MRLVTFSQSNAILNSFLLKVYSTTLIATVCIFVYVHVLCKTIPHFLCIKVSLAVCVRIREWVAAWVNTLTWTYTRSDQLLPSDPHSPFVPTPCTFSRPPLIPFSLSPNPFIVSHLDRSHCHSLATHRWLRDCASRCIVGNHFDQARGHSQRVSIFPLPASGLIKGVTGINPKRLKGNYSVQTYTVITIIDKKTFRQLHIQTKH